MKKFKAFKKSMIGLSLATMLLTGCSKKNDDYKEPLTTEETAEQSQEIEEETHLNDYFEQIAQSIYDEYLEYFSESNLVESKNYSIDDVRNVILFLNDRFESLSLEEIKTSENIIRDSIFPYDLNTEINTLDLIEDVENVNYEDADHVVIEKYPNWSNAILDDRDSAKEQLKEIEQMRDLIANDVRENQTYKNSRDEFNKKIVNMFHHSNQADASGVADSLNNAGKIFAVEASKERILELAKSVNKDTPVIVGDKKDIATGELETLKIGFTTDEQEVIANYETDNYYGFEHSQEDQIAYKNIIESMVQYNYQQSSCSVEALINQIIETNNKTLTK